MISSPALNEISPDEIERLRSNELVHLLRILLYAEASKSCIDSSGVHVPFQINVADGGNDAEWNSSRTPCGYIPKNFTIFQVKAQDMGPQSCVNEIFQSNGKTIKEEVKRVLDTDGAFVFFCRKGYVKSSINTKIEKVRNALKNAGRTILDDETIKFLDGNQIAAWTNRFAASIAYVRQCTGLAQIVAYRNFSHWRKDPLFENEFQSNELLDKYIYEIRTILAKPRSIVRITGPSGLGKTRLGFEVFNYEKIKFNENMREALASSMVYLDMQIQGHTALQWVNQIAINGYSGIVVVDNCNRSDHSLLKDSVSHPSSNLKLMTLDYVPERSLGDSTRHIQLTPEIMKEVIPRILESIPGMKQTLTEAGIKKVAQFAHGFPQIAILTANTGHALNLDTLNQQNGLANRILWGRDIEAPEAKEYIRCLSLFTEVGRNGKYSKQIEFVRNSLCRGVCEYDFNKVVRRFYENRVLQKVGDFVMVAPPPLAAALAAEWLEDIPDSDFEELLPQIRAVNLLDSFCDRLKQLDFSPRARTLCNRLMGGQRPFFSAKVLDSEAGSRVFRALSEVNPQAATECLYRLTKNWNSIKFSEISEGRRNLIWALEKLVWDVDLFPKAARVLRGLAGGENENFSNNATGQFCQLYQIFLPGTKQPLESRLDIVKEGLQSSDDSVKKVCIEALKAALTNNHFSRTGGSEQQGTQLPKEDYQPTSNEEILSYWKSAFEILCDQILLGTELSEQALDVIGSELGGIITTNLAKDIEKIFKEVAKHQKGYWPSAKDEIKHLLNYQKEELSIDQQITIKRFLSYVTPLDLRTRLIDTVSTPGWHHEETKSGDWLDRSKLNAIELANELSVSNDNWESHIDALLTGEQQQGWHFGERCMELSSNPRKLIDRSIKAYSRLESANRNPQLIRGMIHYLSGTKQANEILDEIASSDHLREDLYIPLVSACATSVNEFTNVCNLIEVGKLPLIAIDSFSYGGITNNFEADEFRNSITDFLNSTPDSAPNLLHLVFMFAHGNSDRMEIMKKTLSDLVSSTETLQVIKSSQIGYAWEQCVESLLQSPSEGFVLTVSTAIASFAADAEIYPTEDLYIFKIVRNLLKNHSETAWPVFSSHFRDENGAPRYRLINLLSRSGRFGENGTPLWDLSYEDFYDWAEKNKDIIPYLITRSQLYTIEQLDSSSPSSAGKDGLSEKNLQKSTTNQKDERYAWHPHALALLELCGEELLEGCLRSNLFSFGSTGSRIPYLLKRLSLVEDLTQSENPSLTQIAENLECALKEEIEQETKYDTHRNAGINVW